jgi:hypothetical protein
MAQSHRIIGWTDSVNACDCCGKSDLSGTFCCEIIETGDEVYYGSVCVKRNTGVKNPKSAADAYRIERETAAKAEARLTPEYAAMRARYALRDRSNVPMGKASSDFVRAESEAFRAVAVKIAEKHNVTQNVVICA